MTFIVEDGTGLTDSNTYMDADDIRAYALARGITLAAVSDDVDPISPFMVMAMDYLEALLYTGEKGSRQQALSWPRKFWRCAPAADWVMPTKIQSAQAQLVIEQSNGISLFQSQAGFNQNGGFITLDKTDVLETRYSEKVIPAGPDMPAVTALLRELVVGGNGLLSVRV